jgi:hypothetical protein
MTEIGNRQENGRNTGADILKLQLLVPLQPKKRDFCLSEWTSAGWRTALALKSQRDL